MKHPESMEEVRRRKSESRIPVPASRSEGSSQKQGADEVRQRDWLPGILRQDPQIAESVVCRARLDRETLHEWLIQYCI